MLQMMSLCVAGISGAGFPPYITSACDLSGDVLKSRRGPRSEVARCGAPQLTSPSDVLQWAQALQEDRRDKAELKLLSSLQREIALYTQRTRV